MNSNVQKVENFVKLFMFVLRDCVVLRVRSLVETDLKDISVVVNNLMDEYDEKLGEFVILVVRGEMSHEEFRGILDELSLTAVSRLLKKNMEE